MIKFNLHKEFKSKGKITSFHLQGEFEERKIIAIYGKSGVGKSTLLRMLAGLTNPNKGTITIGDDVWFDSDKKQNIKVNKRSIGFLFQDYSLFPNMTVLQNIWYGAELGKDEELISRIVDIMDIKDLLDRKPIGLSGGQQQRVALARAIARKPRLLLLDEPLSALDAEMRIKLQEEILAIHKLIKTTIVFVSHHLPEVFMLADEVLLVEGGKVTQKGSPSDIFFPSNEKKVNLFGEFISIENIGDEKVLKIMVNREIVGVKIRCATSTKVD